MRAILVSLILPVVFAAGCQTPVKTKTTLARNELAHWLQRAAKADQNQNPAALRLATGKVAESWRENPAASTAPYRLEIKSAALETKDPLYFDAYQPADTCNVRSLNARHTRDGIGAPLVGHKEPNPADPHSKYYPEQGINRAITAVLTFNHARQRATLTFYDPSKSTDVGGQPVAADYSAPLSNALGDVRKLRRLGLVGLFRSDLPELEAGFTLTQPYDPNKTPLIFVHGLLSSHIAWRNLANDLTADPAIRKRYQIWFYHYPTGNPVLLSAAVFRKNLEKLRHDLDPDGSDPAMQHTVIIAHSMGGLLTKTLITDSGEKVWKRVFTISASELKVDPQQHKLIVGSFHWHARRDVKRVIFIAVPHRGSKLATSFIGRFAQRIIRMPEILLNLSLTLVSLDAEALTEESAAALNNLHLTSIQNLSPDDKMVRLLDTLPTAPWVRRHSIIGNRGRGGPLDESSDGVVPYTSSHLDGVDSELIVPGDHGAYKTPEAVAEIKRILQLP